MTGNKKEKGILRSMQVHNRGFTDNSEYTCSIRLLYLNDCASGKWLWNSTNFRLSNGV